MKIIAGHGLLDRIEISGVPRSRRNTVNTNTSARADSSRETCAPTKRYCDKPRRPSFVPEECAHSGSPPAPVSINEWPGRLTGIKACAKTDRDNAPRGFTASAGALDDQGHYRQSGAPNRTRS